MIIDGLWKGEYVYDEYCKVPFKQTTVPFSLSIRQSGIMAMSGGFEGIWQDDTTISDITVPGNVYGVLKETELFFVKLYPRTYGYAHDRSFFVGDEPHPEIHYTGRFWKEDIFEGTWRIERTFRKVNGRLCEIAESSGLWWIKRI
ncbi:MAG TPA: hypothetical protein VIN08_15000 [Ohtaekwangia sp.]|uniref:hypothetical protein n=1 Tax=Ohtaekwangia sp. TaxID=2066019 RepID=UPI002F922593